MIGNSHIDPVWFWQWDEGMQEVKATFQSAIDRLDEFDDVYFTCTSSAFFEWILKINPELFEKIRKRVAEGRWEITGGLYIEPDCHLPTGESFIRHSLYAQRFFKKHFGKICTVGSNVDSFGHSSALPQILKNCGMDSYVLMRVDVKNHKFYWTSKDGTKVKCIQLQSEYTTWFYESTKKGINDTLASISENETFPCCFGMGNHGGGPTIANIQSINQIKDEYKGIANISFGSFKDYFKDFRADVETVENFEKINVGCYSIDSEFKQMHRLAEKRLMMADAILTMERIYLNSDYNSEAKNMEKLWKALLFNQFHDTLGGTYIKPARNEGLMQLGMVASECKRIWTIAIQNIVNTVDTHGDGFPLWIFNPTGTLYEGATEVELDWFCKDELKIIDEKGNEVPYQRVHTLAKVKHSVLGGRRKVVFDIQIPEYGHRVLKLLKQKSIVSGEIISNCLSSPFVIENQYVKVVFDKESGLLSSYIQKSSGYDALNGSMSFDIWSDERDAWGNLESGRYEKIAKQFELQRLTTVEDGEVRKVVKGIYTHANNMITQLYTLYHNSDELHIKTYVNWNLPWHMLKMRFPINVNTVNTTSEYAVGTIERQINDHDEYYMHKFIDISDNGYGLVIANDSKYAFSFDNTDFNLTVLRSAIYAQGNSENWHEPLDRYDYTDIGEQEFNMILKIHSHNMPQKNKYKIANWANNTLIFLADSQHDGYNSIAHETIQVLDDNVMITSMKKAEESNDVVIRLLELEGTKGSCTLVYGDNKATIDIDSYHLKTIMLNPETGKIININYIEMKEQQ